MEVSDFVFKYAKTELNPTGYEKATKILAKMRSKQKGHLFAYSNAEVIFHAVSNGYLPTQDGKDFLLQKDGQTFNVGIKTETEYNFAIFLTQVLKQNCE